MVIDARNKLKPEDISHFIENATDCIIFAQIKPDNTTLVISELNRRNFVQSITISLENVNDTDEFVCSSEDTRLLITGMDINWWKANARRYNKLFKAAEEALSKEPPQTYRLGIATLMEGQLSQINLIEGTKDVVLKSLNENIRHRYIDSFLKAQIVINLAYEEGDENDVEQWYTLDELRDMKAIKMEG